MKSGTTYVQQRMVRAPEGLAAHGFLFPGRGWGEQVSAVSDVLGTRRRAREDVDGAWERMAEEIRAHDGTAVISMEFLGPANAASIQRIVDAFPGTRIEMVLTVRDLNRTIVAMWQENIKNGRDHGWRSYLRSVRTSGDAAGRMFWRQQGAFRIVQCWREVLGADNVTVVTVPRPGAASEELWLRFCRAIALPPEACPPTAPANESLGAASVQVMRRVNEALAEYDVPWPAYSKELKFGLAKSILTRHRAEEEPLGLKAPRWLRKRAAQMRARLEDSGVRVVGDLADLEPVSTRGVDGDTVSVEAQLDAAIFALAKIAQRNIERAQGSPLGPAKPVVDDDGSTADA
jgi:hypothetical protein